MEVKMFLFNDAAEAEENINNWLKNNTVKVQHISQSHCERNGRLLFIVSIYYFENQGYQLQSKAS